MEDEDMQRRMFHDNEGRVDFRRLFENLTPTALVGAIVIYGNSLVSQYQVKEVKEQVTKVEAQVSKLEDRMGGQNEKLGSQNEKLVGLNEKVTAYLGQQTQLNAAMDARLTYLERALPARR